MSIGEIDHWYELVAWLVLIIVGPGGGVLIANRISDARRQKERGAQMEESLDLHDKVLRDAIREENSPLVDKINQIARVQEQQCRDTARIVAELSVDRQRHAKLEADTYTAISRAEAALARNHPPGERLLG